MPNVHPLFVHFPIALLLTSIALDWAGLRWKGTGLGFKGGELVYTFGIGVAQNLR